MLKVCKLSGDNKHDRFTVPGIRLLCVVLFLCLFITACGKRARKVPPAHSVPETALPSPKHPVSDAAASSPKSTDGIDDIRLPRTPAQSVPPPPVIRPSSPEAEFPLLSGDFNPGPLIRIGLTTTARELRISSAGGYYVMEKVPESPRQLVTGDLQVRIEQGPASASSGTVSETAPIVFHIQVASFSVPENAKELQEKLSGRFNVPAAVFKNNTTGMSQVRLGEFSRKEEAQTFLTALMEAGHPDAFIISDAVAGRKGDSRMALSGPGNQFRLSETGFLFSPVSSDALLSVDGKPYRGSFDVFLNSHGRITLVNQVGIEEYLLGVVPAELSPVLYPEFAALAAQAIAARTYALKNRGRYRSEGFDLTNDTRTQVYNGVSGEHEVTNDIVRRTSGVAIYHQDQLIDAMYMSTCGGRTEDFAKVYDAKPVPYLTSVSCTVDGIHEKGEITLNGNNKNEEPFLEDSGFLANRDIAFAHVLGITGAGECCDIDFLGRSIQRDEAIRWVENAAIIAGRSPSRHQPSPLNSITRSGFLLYAAESFFGTDEIRKRISAGDMEYYTAHLKDGPLTQEPVRYALSYLMQHGLWRPNSDNSIRPDDPLRRGDAITLLLRWVESARPGILRQGVFREAVPDNPVNAGTRTIMIRMDNRTQEFRVSNSPYLFRVDSGQKTPVQTLRLIGTEKISFFMNPAGIVEFIEAELTATGAASDRFSSVATWTATISRSTAAGQLLALTGDIGTFRDLRPYSIGDSGRAVQMEVVGSRKSVVLNGYRVRNALSLRDTLFSIIREFASDGSVANFIFSGRGWGHGVGLCQTGAFGMARAGRSAEEILKTYYQGVQIRKAY
jgi:stage II sporulation protein D